MFKRNMLRFLTTPCHANIMCMKMMQFRYYLCWKVIWVNRCFIIVVVNRLSSICLFMKNWNHIYGISVICINVIGYSLCFRIIIF